ncbi:hypothetical protein QTI66_35025 [Variovorax sp. J22R133]|nr:hypothetical protein [Variovorax sp. J22R133]MDM0117332.1 hypothetical protein [Variovorax sp. J22R133]
MNAALPRGLKLLIEPDSAAAEYHPLVLWCAQAEIPGVTLV